MKRNVGQIVDSVVQQQAETYLESGLELAKQMMKQEKTSKNKVYSARAPEVE